MPQCIAFNCPFGVSHSGYNQINFIFAFFVSDSIQLSIYCNSIAFIGALSVCVCVYVCVSMCMCAGEIPFGLKRKRRKRAKMWLRLLVIHLHPENSLFTSISSYRLGPICQMQIPWAPLEFDRTQAQNYTEQKVSMQNKFKKGGENFVASRAFGLEQKLEFVIRI